MQKSPGLILVLLACCAFCNCISAQEFSFLEGPEVDARPNLRFIGFDAENFYVTNSEGESDDHREVVAFYSRSTLKPIAKVDLTIAGLNAGNYVVHAFHSTLNGVLLFYSYHDNDEKKEVLMVAGYDKSGSVNMKAKPLAKVDYKNKSYGHRWFQAAYNEKSEHIIVTAHQPDNVNLLSKETIHTHFYVFDEKTTPLFDHLFTYDIHDVDDLRKPMAYDKNDNVYSLVQESGKLSDRVGVVDRLYLFDLRSGKVYSQNIFPNAQDKKTELNKSAQSILEDNNGNMMIISTYGAGINTESFGLYLAKIDAVNGTVTNEKMFSWTESDNPREKGKEVIKLKSYVFESVKFLPDNRLKIILGKNFKTTNNGVAWHCSEDVFDLTMDGKIASMKYIWRDQCLGDEGLSQSIVYYRNDETYLLYNETPENIAAPDDKKKSHSNKKRENVPCATHVDKTGAVHRNKLLQKHASERVLIYPKTSLAMDTQEVITLMEVNYKTYFLKISLQ